MDPFGTRKRTPVNDNVWRLLDLDRVCETGGKIYTRENYEKFFCHYFNVRVGSIPPIVELWCVNRRYILCFKHDNVLAHMKLWQKTLHKGPTDKPGIALPMISDEDQMELDSMCIFLVDVLEHHSDPKKRRWSK